MGNRALLLMVVVPCIAAAVWAQSPREPTGLERLEAVLERMGAVQEETTSLQAEFVQRRSSPLLAEPSVSEGRFYFRAPDTVLWEYTAPRPMRVLIADGVALTYRPEEGRAERVEIGRFQRRIFGFLGASEPLETLRRYFAITFRVPEEGGDYTLHLEPATFQLKRRIEVVELTIDRERLLPVGIAYSDGEGDSTSYVFSDIQRNRPIPEDIFSLDLPPGTEVVEVKIRSSDE